MKYYKKRTLKNRIKYHIQRITTNILVITAILFITNCLIEKLKTVDIYKTTKSVIEIHSVEAQEEVPIVGGLVSKDTVPLASAPVQGNAEDIKGLVSYFFPNDTQTALAICHAESGLNPETESTTDRMKDGRPVSIGLMQINLTNHQIGGVDCSKAFSGINNQAVVINESLYNQCVNLAKNPELNLKEAKKIYEGAGWNRWGAYTNNSYLNFL